jgi:uncharacterized membrane protein
MGTHISVWWEKLRTGLWPVPLGMLALALLLFSGARYLDQWPWSETFLRKWWLHSGSGDDARNLLSTLLSAIITMSSVVFSITIVALALAASQFGSRLVRVYMVDARTKLSLGIFMMTIVYCLLALRAVQHEMSPADVPHITVTVGLVLGLLCVIALLFFLHVVARSIVADEVVKRVGRELETTIDELPSLPEHPPQEAAAIYTVPADFDQNCWPVRGSAEGYVQAIDHEHLAAFAARHQRVVRLDCRAGDFLCRGGTLAFVYPADGVEGELAKAVEQGVIIGNTRTPAQDLEFSLRHLVDVALRALSAAINDPNTAMVVIDRITAALAVLMGKRLPPMLWRDDAGTVRLVCKDSGYTHVLDSAFNQIRRHAADHPSVVVNLLNSLGKIAEQARLPEQRDALRRHVLLIAGAGLRNAVEASDRDRIEQSLAATQRKLDSRLPVTAVRTLPY